RPEIARLVTELPEARTEGPLDAEDIRAWREAANEHAARNAGFAFQGYVRRRLDSVQAYVARALSATSGMREGAPEERIVEAIVAAWTRRRGIVYRDEPATRSAAPGVAGSPPWLEFLHAFDVEFRRRRLAFMIQGQNRLYAMLSEREHSEARRQVDVLKRSFYMYLDRLRRYDSPEFYRTVACTELQTLFAKLEPEQMASLDDYAETFAAENEAAITSHVERLASAIDLPATVEELDVLLAEMDVEKWA